MNSTIRIEDPVRNSASMTGLSNNDTRPLFLSLRFRRLMERVFREDFSGIRVQTGDGVAENHSTLAVAAGNEIHLANVVFLMGSAETQFILAHELAHVVQQRRGLRFSRENANLGQLWFSDFERCEKEAAQAASLAVIGRMPSITGAVEYGLRQQFNTAFTLQRPVQATYKIVVVNKDVTKDFVAGINRTEGHEAITREALKNLSDARWGQYEAKLNEGNRRVDVPKSLDDVNDPGKRLVQVTVVTVKPPELQFDDPDVDKAWTDFGHLQDDNVSQKNHFLLTPYPILLPGQPPDPARDFQDSYNKAMDFIKSGIDTAGKAASAGNLDDAANYFGNVLHCIQDSFSEAHVVRVEDPPNSGIWCIKKLNQYSKDPKLNEHDAAYDDVGASGKGGPGSQRAIQATTEYLRNVSAMMFDGRTPDWTPYFNKYFSLLKRQATIKVNATKQ